MSCGILADPCDPRPGAELKPPQPNPTNRWITSNGLTALWAAVSRRTPLTYRAASTTTPFEGEWEPMLTQPGLTGRMSKNGSGPTANRWNSSNKPRPWSNALLA